MLGVFADFVKAFVPIFVAVDAVGLVPIYLSLTEGIERRQRRAILMQSVITALAVAVGFIFLGRALFEFMGITVSDFQVAGGSLLFIIATLDLVSGRKMARQTDSFGAVPLGTPLIVGPGTLTAALILVGTYGTWLTLASVTVNLALAWAVLAGAEFFERVVGRAGSRALSKVVGVILAAYAVMMVRKGIVDTVLDLAGR